MDIKGNHTQFHENACTTYNCNFRYKVSVLSPDTVIL